MAVRERSECGRWVARDGGAAGRWLGVLACATAACSDAALPLPPPPAFPSPPVVPPAADEASHCTPPSAPVVLGSELRDFQASPSGCAMVFREGPFNGPQALVVASLDLQVRRVLTTRPGR